jgi:hypothetical protein
MMAILRAPNFCGTAWAKNSPWLSSRPQVRKKYFSPCAVKRTAVPLWPTIFVAHSPAEGFPLLRKFAAVRDRDMAWIIRENLKKKRLTEPFGKDVEQVVLFLEEANAK